eukprot:7286692-Prymnesium_polylepis.1
MAQRGALPGASGSGARRTLSNIVSQADWTRTSVKTSLVQALQMASFARSPGAARRVDDRRGRAVRGAQG